MPVVARTLASSDPSIGGVWSSSLRPFAWCGVITASVPL
jgi:hypothetical protein